MSAEIIVDASNFDQEVINSDIPVIVDFWAEWCVPCKMIGPILEEVADDYAGRLKVAKLNVDEAGEIAARFNIISIPTLMVFKDGEAAAQQVGAVSRDVIEGLFKDLI
ncbi:MAG: thioredoxin [Spirochaetes bacterium]|nr:MAG: thioredoxin [Spirochaetota bacterium]